MPFEFSSSAEGCKDQLLEGGDGTGQEAQPFPIQGDEVPGQNHICHPKGG